MANNKYHHIIRKLIVGFGSIFDNLTLTRYNSDEEEEQAIKVPITYAPKEKYVNRLLGDPNLDKKVQITLPRLSYDLTNMYYDASRKQVSGVKNIAASSSGLTAYSQYNPVPYNFDFELYLYVRNLEDGDQLIEYILPYFTPSYTIKLNLIPTMGIVKEVPVTLNSVDTDVEFEGERDSDTRVIIWTLKFTVKSYLYGAISESSVIKQSIVNIKNLSNIGAKDTISLNVSSTGTGTYKIGEEVFQGYSFGMASGKAEVVSYSNVTNILKVTNLQGDLKTNTYLYGVTTGTERTLINVLGANSRMASINVAVIPKNALANSNYKIKTTITEY
jgi:hypothetical protein